MQSLTAAMVSLRLGIARYSDLGLFRTNGQPGSASSDLSAWIGTVLIRTLLTLKNPKIDQPPNEPGNGYQRDQYPPAGFASVMSTLDGTCQVDPAGGHGPKQVGPKRG